MKKENHEQDSEITKNSPSEVPPGDNATGLLDETAQQDLFKLESAEVCDNIMDSFVGNETVPHTHPGSETVDDVPGLDLYEVGLAEEPVAWHQAKHMGVSSATSDKNIARLNATFEEGLSALLQAFEAKLAYDQSKQVQIDRLYDDLQQHRSDLVARTVRPLINGIIRLHDDVGKLVGSLKDMAAEELTPKRFFDLFDGFKEDMEHLLGDNGVTIYRESNGPFDPRRQRMLRKVPTNDAALDGMVAESLRPGFEQGMQTLEKERIAAYEYRPAEEEEARTGGSSRAAETQGSDQANKDDGHG